MARAKPELIVFDLDYTLWPFWIDTDVTPPFHRTSTGEINDKRGRKVSVYPEVPTLLQRLHLDGIRMGLASRTTEIEPAKQLVTLLGWDKYFPLKEIYPKDKKEHFKEFARRTRIPFKKMLFFDDEQRNITSVSSLGVTCILADNGMSAALLKQGMERFASKH